LQIPNYNFDWQLAYEVRNPLPAGTTIEAVAVAVGEISPL
jgi:hypothetical protein